MQSAPSAPSAPASLVVPSRFQASEESSPEQGAGGKKGNADKTGKKKKDKKAKKDKKTKKTPDDDEDEECEDDHEPLGKGGGDDDDEGNGFDDLDGYDELVDMQESKGPKKRPASGKAAACRKKPAKKHDEAGNGLKQNWQVGFRRTMFVIFSQTEPANRKVLPFHHMIEGAEMGECRPKHKMIGCITCWASLFVQPCCSWWFLV